MLTDFAPTLLRAANVDVPATMKGHDLGATTSEREFVFAENKLGQTLMARSDRYKLLWSPDRAQRRFFDLENDPLETTDVSGDAQMAAEIERHRAALAHWAMFEALPPTCLDLSAPLAPDIAKTRGNATFSARWSHEKFAEYLAQRDNRPTT